MTKKIDIESQNRLRPLCTGTPMYQKVYVATHQPTNMSWGEGYLKKKRSSLLNNCQLDIPPPRHSPANINIIYNIHEKYYSF